jgi:hypothetical protein
MKATRFLIGFDDFLLQTLTRRDTIVESRGAYNVNIEFD